MVAGLIHRFWAPIRVERTAKGSCLLAATVFGNEHASGIAGTVGFVLFRAAASPLVIWLHGFSSERARDHCGGAPRDWVGWRPLTRNSRRAARYRWRRSWRCCGGPLYVRCWFLAHEPWTADWRIARLPHFCSYCSSPSFTFTAVAHVQHAITIVLDDTLRNRSFSGICAVDRRACAGGPSYSYCVDLTRPPGSCGPCLASEVLTKAPF